MSAEHSSDFVAGQQAAILAEHTTRLDKINGSVERFGTELRGVKDEVHEMGEDQKRRAKVAAAQEELARNQEAAREKRTERRQHKFQVAVTGLLAVLAIFQGIGYIG